MAADARVLRRDLGAFAEAIGLPLAEHQAQALQLRKRITTIRAPRQAGKSRGLVVLGLHRTLGKANLRALVVSAGDEAAKRVLGEMRTAAATSPLLAGSVVDESASLIRLRNGSTVRSVPASEHQVRGNTIDLLLLDEVALLDDALVLSAAIPTTAAREGARIVMASSPGAPVGVFYDYVRRGEEGSEHVDSFRWSLEESPWIDQTQVDEARDALPADAFAREYFGEFVDSGDELVIGRSLIEAAQLRTLDAMWAPAYGLDIARHGGDETVLMSVRNGVARVVWAARGIEDLMLTAEMVAGFMAAQPGAHVLVDAAGMGWGVLDRLRGLRVDARPFNAATRSSDRRRYLNLRSEAWWLARDAFREGAVDLDPADRMLAAQLGAVTYGLHPSGAIQIQAKDQMKASPDRADALVIALQAARVQQRVREWQAKREADAPEAPGRERTLADELRRGVVDWRTLGRARPKW